MEVKMGSCPPAFLTGWLTGYQQKHADELEEENWRKRSKGPVGAGGREEGEAAVVGYHETGMRLGDWILRRGGTSEDAVNLSASLLGFIYKSVSDTSPLSNHLSKPLRS